jgi:hypothetical protein
MISRLFAYYLEEFKKAGGALTLEQEIALRISQENEAQ